MLTRLPLPTSFASPLYDTLIIGGGVVGCALARELVVASNRNLKICVIERANDVGEGGASKANSAIAHTGFDAEPGSMEAKLVCQASRKWPDMAAKLKIPYAKVGALMVATLPEQMAYLEKYHKNAQLNDVKDVELLTGDVARAMEPNVASGSTLLGGLLVKNEAVVDPFAVCSSMAEIAVSHGCDFFLQHEVTGVTCAPDGTFNVSVSHAATTQPTPSQTTLTTKYIINCAGLGARRVADMYGGAPFDVNPRRGQFLLYDKNLRSAIHHILLPVPGPLGKGILVTPTVFGNVLVGPDAEDLTMAQVGEATQTTVNGLRAVRESATRLLPELKHWRPMASYAGARANCKQGSYLLRYNDGPNPGIMTVAGVRSTGISACFELAREIRQGMEKEMGLQLKTDVGVGRVKDGRDRYPVWYIDGKDNNTTTICYCENVTRDDLVRELNTGPWQTLVDNTDSLKHRTRVTQGRCQGFNCLPNVCRVIAEEKNMVVEDVSKNGKGSEWFPFRGLDRVRGRVRAAAATNKTAPSNDDNWDLVIIGGGPSGCGSLRGLYDLSTKKRVLLVERCEELGGIPARYVKSGPKTFISPRLSSIITGYELAEFLRDDVARILSARKDWAVQTGVLVTSIIKDDSSLILELGHDKTKIRTKQVILASGARESTATEKGLIAGHRTNKVIFTNHLLDVGGGGHHVLQDEIYAGAGLIARGHHLMEPSQHTMFLAMPRDEDRTLAHWYFGGPSVANHGNPPGEIRIHRNGTVSLFLDKNLSLPPIHVDLSNPTSKVICSGELVPNDELWRGARGFQSEIQLKDYVTKVGNVAPHMWQKIWPAMLCWIHARATTTLL